jgi:hypothetical protein
MAASTVASEVGYTAAPNVAVHLSLTDACAPLSARLSNDGSTFGSEVAYDALNTTLSWALSAGDGSKTVDVQVSDGADNTALLASQTIVLDTTKPTVPGTLTRTVACSGSNRTVTLHWGISTDTWLHGYRVYTSTDGVTWTAAGTTSAFTYSDNHRKSLDSVRYQVVAYDRAGNESNATNIVSLAKNQCS